MDETRTAERLARVEQDLKSVHERLDNLKELTESVYTMANELKATRENVNRIDGRLNEIEQRPLRRLEKIVVSVVTAATTAIVGFLVGHFLK